MPVPKPVEQEPVASRRLIAPVVPTTNAAQRDGAVQARTDNASQGSGVNGGTGTGRGTGDGEGVGAGIGPGSGGGTGGGPYRAGSGVEAPRLLREVKATYTDEARRRGTTGNVILEIVITRDGTVGDVSVRRGLGGRTRRTRDRGGPSMEIRACAAARPAGRCHRRSRGGIQDALIMLTITLLSLVVAAASGFFAWRALRREHLRSSARVASLAAAMDEGALLPLRAFETGLSFESSDEFRSETSEFRSEEPVPGATLTFEAMDQPSIRRRLLSVVIGRVCRGCGRGDDRDDERPLRAATSTHRVAARRIARTVVARCVTRRLHARGHRCRAEPGRGTLDGGDRGRLGHRCQGPPGWTWQRAARRDPASQRVAIRCDDLGCERSGAIPRELSQCDRCDSARGSPRRANE